MRELEIPTAFHDLLKGALNRRTLTDLRECSEFRREIKDHPAARFAEMLRQHLEQEGWAIVDGFELRHDMRDEQFLTALVSSLGQPTYHSHGLTDLVWAIRPQSSRDGNLSSSIDMIPLHTDSSFKPQPERFIALLAIENDGDGDSHWLRIDPVLRELEASADGRDCVRVLSQLAAPVLPPPIFRFPQQAQRYMVLGASPRVRFRHDLIERALLDAPDRELSGALQHLREAIERSAHRVSYRLRSGQALVLDNHRFLHGRSALSNTERLLLRMRFD